MSAYDASPLTLDVKHFFKKPVQKSTNFTQSTNLGDTLWRLSWYVLIHQIQKLSYICRSISFSNIGECSKTAMKSMALIEFKSAIIDN